MTAVMSAMPNVFWPDNKTVPKTVIVSSVLTFKLVVCFNLNLLI